MVLLVRIVISVWLPYVFVAENKIETTVLRTPVGPIQGFKATNKHTQLTVYEFRGIPYGKPPLGPLRFRKPLPVDPWTDTLKAMEFGAGCPQKIPEGLTDFEPSKMSEDCLYLNVYVPGDLDAKKKLPVMVWIHGGGLELGFAHQYDGGWIATEGNVIVVTINYRLDVFGFLAVNDKASKGNYGLWDQKLALEWVHKNIASFGGNHESVTIFGESAGGWSSSYQSLIPSNKGLFQRVICQSGIVSRLSFLRKKQISQRIKELSNKTSCPMENMDAFVNCLRKISMEGILNVIDPLGSHPEDRMLYQMKYLPVVDGELYQDHPIRQLEDRLSEVSKFFGSLDFIAGYTSNEANLLPDSMDPAFQKYFDFNSADGIPTRAVRNGMIFPFVEEFFNNDSTIKQKISEFYTVLDSKDEQSVKAMEFSNAVWFTYWTVEMLDFHSTLGGRTYQYQFSKTDNLHLFGAPPAWAKGCGHGEDLQYMFDINVLFPSLNESYVDEETKEFSRQLLQYWTQFAKNGQPDGWEGAVPWTQYDLKARNYLDFDIPITLKSNLDPISIDFWKNQIPQIELEPPEDVSLRDEL